MKLPGIYYAFSVILTIFGQTSWGIHVGLLCVNAATVLILFFLARRLLHDSMAAAVAASAFGVLTLDRWILGVFAHATHFVGACSDSGTARFAPWIGKDKEASLRCGGLVAWPVRFNEEDRLFLPGSWNGIAALNGARRAGALRSGMFHAVLLVVNSGRCHSS